MIKKYGITYLLAMGAAQALCGAIPRQETPSVYTTLKQSLPFAHMRTSIQIKPVYAAPKTSYVKNACSGMTHAIIKSPFRYDFYHISDARTDLHLHRARLLLQYYFQEPDGPRSKKMEDKIAAVQLQAANECAKWITPTLQKLRDSFSEDEILKKYSCPVVGVGKVPIKIGAVTRAVSLPATEIELAPLYSWQGSECIDKDVLKGTLAHETSHLLHHDGLFGLLEIAAGIDPLESTRRQEINADAYACTSSKSACLGLIKLLASQCKVILLDARNTSPIDVFSLNNVKSTSYSYVASEVHASRPDLLRLAVKYAQEHWNISLEECQRYIQKGEQLAVESIRQHGAKKALNKK